MFEAGGVLSQQPAKAEPVYENWDKLLDFEIYIIYLPVSNAMLLFHSDNLKTSDSPIPSDFECLLLLLHNGISKEK